MYLVSEKKYGDVYCYAHLLCSLIERIGVTMIVPLIYCYAYCKPFTLQFNWTDWSNSDSNYQYYSNPFN